MERLRKASAGMNLVLINVSQLKHGVYLHLDQKGLKLTAYRFW